MNFGTSSFDDADLLLCNSSHTEMRSRVTATLIASAKRRSDTTKHAFSLDGLVWGNSMILGRRGLVEDRCVYNIVYWEALHLVQIFTHAVVVIPLQKVFKRHEWFASTVVQRWLLLLRQVNWLGKSVSCSHWVNAWLVGQGISTCLVKVARRQKLRWVIVREVSILYVLAVVLRLWM